MKKEKPLKYSSEGIPFPPNMGMDEKGEYFIFYDSKREFTEKNKKPRAFLHKIKKTLTFYSRDDESWKAIDFSSVVNGIEKTLFEIENHLDTRKEISEEMMAENKLKISPFLTNLSDIFTVMGVCFCYTHYKIYMSQWKK